jgi:hypothetical protein
MSSVDISNEMSTEVSHDDYSKSSTTFIARLGSEARKGNNPFSFWEEPFALLSDVRKTYPMIVMQFCCRCGERKTLG